MKDVNQCFSASQNTVSISEKKQTIWLNEREVFHGDGHLFATIQKEDFFIFGNSNTIFSGKIKEDNFKITDSNGVSWGTYSDKGVIIYKNRLLDEQVIDFKGDAYYHEFKTGQEKLLFKQEFGGFIFTFHNDNKALYRRLNTLKSLSLETGDYLWEVSLSAYGYQDSALGYVDAQIRQVIGISDNVLVVYMQSGTLVGIDTQTGAILWDIPFSWTYYPSDYQGNGWYWHLEDGFLYLLQHRYYLRIDLATQKLEVLWQLPDNSMDIEDCSYDSDYAYFMAIDTSVSMIQPSILGVFDRKALKIVWQHDKPIGSSKPPQSDGNKLYCLDNEGVLHIFEKENVT